MLSSCAARKIFLFLRSPVVGLSCSKPVCRVVSICCKKNQRTMCDLQGKTFCIELGDGPFYFKVTSASESCKKTPEKLPTSVAKLFDAKDLCYVTGFTDGVSYASNDSRHNALIQSLSGSQLTKHIPGLMFSDGRHFERGCFVNVESSGSPDNTKILLSLASKHGTGRVMKINSVDDGAILRVKILNGVKETESSDASELSLTPMSIPSVHPAFMLPGTSSVYHDLQRAYDVLNECEYFAEIDQLKEICDKFIRKDGHDYLSKLPLKVKNPVIVIEGLDATGKTTLTKNLGSKLKATVLKSPPECICHLRSMFDSKTQLVRRAFYTLGNYAFAAMIQDAAEKGVVIADRFWNSTAAYAIATDVSVGGPECLPPAGHWVYSWPSDLLKADAVFLLMISDAERRRRLLQRGTVKTDEEIRLERSSPFRLRLEESYKRMENPKMQLLDASGTEAEVLDKTLEILQAGGYI